jgi:hypothetical protein
MTVEPLGLHVAGPEQPTYALLVQVPTIIPPFSRDISESLRTRADERPEKTKNAVITVQAINVIRKCHNIKPP